MNNRTSTQPIFVVGGGGHAKVVVATLEAAGNSVAGILDDDEAKWDTILLGFRVSGPTERAVTSGAKCILAIGDNQVRRRLALRLDGSVEWGISIHPKAYVHPSVKIGKGTVIFAGAVIQPDTRIGMHTIVNTGSSIDHDGLIGDYAHIGPGARLAGDVSVEEGALMGIGSVAIPGIRIGSWATVGAGGVVTRDLDAGVTAVGVPARPVERLSSFQ